MNANDSRRFNTDYWELRVEAADGSRLKEGLVEDNADVVHKVEFVLPEDRFTPVRPPPCPRT